MLVISFLESTREFPVWISQKLLPVLVPNFGDISALNTVLVIFVAPRTEKFLKKCPGQVPELSKKEVCYHWTENHTHTHTALNYIAGKSIHKLDANNYITSDIMSSENNVMQCDDSQSDEITKTKQNTIFQALSDPTKIHPPYRETGVAIPLSYCVSCGIADYRCNTPLLSVKMADRRPKTDLTRRHRRENLF